MRLKEKLIRKLNNSVQSSSASRETKLFTENTVLVMDISKKLVELIHDGDASYEQHKQMNEKLHHIMEELQK
ncbi:MAG: hypothetical protein J6Q53_04960 [Oscillospiraceae bacterium]|nr:hypothetical protein [Oscillospiraceae bacterium]